MAAANECTAPYEGAGAGGKFRKKPIRRSQTTPYDRPPIAIKNPSIISSSSNSLLSKLVDPASKLLYAGAHRLFGVFRKRITLPPSERPPEAIRNPNDRLGEVVTNLEDCTKGPEQGNQNENSSNASGATEISELEKILKQRSFTRSEMEHLTKLLHSRTSDVPVEDKGKREEPKVQRDPLNPNRKKTDIFPATVSTHVTSSVVINEDIGSPAELAKAYMGSRPSNVSPSILGLHNHTPRDDSLLLTNGSVFPKSSNAFQLALASNVTKGLGIHENGFTTPRSRGRSAIYSMARPQYSKSHLPESDKGIVLNGGPSSSLTPSLSASAWVQEGSVGTRQMTLKRRSFVLEDDFGSVSPMRRIRQKHNLLSQGGLFSAHGREHGSGATQYLPSSSSKNVLLSNGSEHRIQKPAEMNGDTPVPFSRYASVTKSSEMATKILQHLEKMSPKDKPSQSKGDCTVMKSPSNLGPTMLHGQALRNMDALDSSKFLVNTQGGYTSDKLHDTCLPDARDSILQNDKVEEDGSNMFEAPSNSSLKNTSEPPKKKRSFQMSAHEDFLEMDDEIISNGLKSTPVVEKDEKVKTSVIVSKEFSSEAVLPSKSLPFPESNTSAPSVPIQRADFGMPNNSAVGEEKTGLTFSPSTSTPTYESSLLTKSTSTLSKFTPMKEANASPSSTISTKTTDKVESFTFTSSVFGSESSDTQKNYSSDAKVEMSSSLVNVASLSTNDQVKVSESNKADENSTQYTVNGIRKSDTLPSAESAPSKSGIFSFSIPAKYSEQNNNEKDSAAITSTDSLPSASAAPVENGSFSFGAPTYQSDLNGTLSSSSSSFLMPPTASNLINQFLNNSSNAGSSTMSSLPSSDVNASTTTSSGLLKTSASPIFSSGLTPATPVSLSPTSASAPSITSGAKVNDTKIKNDLESPFVFGFNSSMAPPTPASQSHGSLFSTASASTASTQSTPFQFGSNAQSVFGTSSGSTSLANPFSSTTASFSQTSSAFGSNSSTVSSFGMSSSSAASTSSSPSMVFGSTTTNGASSSGSSLFSYGAGTSTSSFPSFANTQPVFGNNNNNNVPMGMENSMAEDPMNSSSPSPAIPVFSQPASHGFMFGSTATATAAAPTQGVPFQFGGQSNRVVAQNPFQASSSLEFNGGGGGGSFSLGSGGGDKSGRRIVRASKNKNRRK